MNEIHLLWIHIYCTGQVTVGDNTRARLTSQLSHLESHRVKPESSITEKTHMRSNRTLHIIGLHLVHTTSVFRFCLNETATASTKSFTDDGQNSDYIVVPCRAIKVLLCSKNLYHSTVGTDAHLASY